MYLHGSPNLREGLKIIPSDSSSRVIFHSSQVSEAYGPFSLAPKEKIFSRNLAGSFWALKIG